MPFSLFCNAVLFYILMEFILSLWYLFMLNCLFILCLPTNAYFYKDITYFLQICRYWAQLYMVYFIILLRILFQAHVILMWTHTRSSIRCRITSYMVPYLYTLRAIVPVFPNYLLNYTTWLQPTNSQRLPNRNRNNKTIHKYKPIHYRSTGLLMSHSDG
jgi:hypothetical protein